MSRQDRHSSTLLSHLPTLLFLLAASLLTFLPWFLKGNKILLSLPGDPFGVAWGLWRVRYSVQNHLSLDNIKLIAYPYGFKSVINVNIIWDGLLYPVNLLFGEVFTYNLFTFISYPLTAMTMYLLAWRITRRRAAALVSAFIFTFSPYHLMRSLQHLTLAHIEWLPLYFLALLKLKERLSPVRGLFVAGAFVLLFLSNYYYGYFTLIITAALIIFYLFYRRFEADEDMSTNKDKGKYLTLATLILGLVVVIGVTYPILTRWQEVKTIYGRSIEELYIYSARPLEYLTPSIDNPIFGPYVQRFVDLNLHRSNVFEQSLYLGFIPLILAVLAVAGLKRYGKKERFFIYASMVGGAGALLFSAPPTINLFNITVPMPSLLAYKIAPFFRVYARFGIFVMLFVAILAAMGFKLLSDKLKTRGSRLALLALVLILITLEFMTFPPWRYTNIDKSTIPAAYSWLAKQPGDGAVAEYPWAASIDYVNSRYLFYQRFHKKKLANGAAMNSRGEQARSRLQDFSDPKLPARLRALGIKYIIIHTGRYRQGMIADEMKRYYGGRYSLINRFVYNGGIAPEPNLPGLKLVRDFNGDKVYKVSDK